MVLNTSILNTTSTTHLIEKIKDHYQLPLASVIHTDQLKVIKEKGYRCRKTTKSFILTDNYLFYLAKEPVIEDQMINFTIKARIELKWVVCKFEVKEYPSANKYYIELTKNGRRIIFDAVTEGSYQKWIEVLKPRVIQLNFRSIYRIDNLIATKDNSQLFKVIENSTNNIYFADKIKKHDLQDESAVNKLIEQITILQDIRSFEGVVQLHEIYETNNSLYLIYNPYFGGPVFNHTFVYSPSLIIKILKSILEILVQLEEKKIKHGYLRPKNIYFKYSYRQIEDNEIIITDFAHSKKVVKRVSFFQDSGPDRIEILKKKAEKTSIYSDTTDLGLIILNYLYYTQFNKPMGKTVNYETIILDPTFTISSERKLKSQRPALTDDQHRSNFQHIGF